MQQHRLTHIEATLPPGERAQPSELRESIASMTSASDRADAAPVTQAEPPRAHLRRLWERMVANYGQSWISVHGVSPQSEGTGELTLSGETWSIALTGITGAQIGEGLKAALLEGRDFPPSAGRFRGLCLGVPSYGRVQTELAGRLPRSRFTHAVWQLLDDYTYRQSNGADQARMLRATYDAALEAVARGMALPDVPVAEIGRPVEGKPKVATAEQAETHFADIRSLWVDDAEAENG